MKAINMNSNNHNIPTIKRYFNCEKCNNLFEQKLPINKKGIKCDKCDKCGYLLREISEKDYLKKIYNFVKGEQPNNIRNMNSNNLENFTNNTINNNQINKIVNIDKNNINNININHPNNKQMNIINNINFTNKINIDNNLSDEDYLNNNIINKNLNNFVNSNNIQKINNLYNNNINNINQIKKMKNQNNINIINNNMLINNINKDNISNNINIQTNNINIPSNNHINFINNNLVNNNINNNFNNHNNINKEIKLSPSPIINNYNINNNINPSFPTSNIINNNQNNIIINQGNFNHTNNINNLNSQRNIPQNIQNNNPFLRQNTTPLVQPSNIPLTSPFQNNNINRNNNQINNNPYKKSKSSNINNTDFWQRVDSHKERKINKQSSSNQNENIRIQALNSVFNDNIPQLSINNNNRHTNRHEDPMNEVLDDFFGDFFNESPSTHIEISSSNSPHIFFHSFFSPFGIRENDFSQNYFSNFNRNFFTDFVSLIEANQRGGRNAHPPASKEALKKLKRFPLEERFCKKKDGKVELPNCCICQCEIELGNETVLLPCGHMYHWDCCSQWLNTNNTCPICRFEIK